MTFGLSGTALAAIAVGGATIGSGLIGANGTKNASNAQVQADQAGIDEYRRQFEALQALMAPFVSAGTGALSGQQNLLGLNGQASQQSAIDAIQNSPLFQSQLQQGNNAILANASATGGLRGGNTQAALAQFAPSMLSQAIQQQYQNLGGLSAMGQNAAAGVGNAGMQTGSNVANLLQQQGAARAGGYLGQAQGFQSLLGGITSGLGAFSGMGGKF